MTDLKGKKLLVLGGIISMIEVVKRAKELGIIVYVTDYLSDSPAKKYADKSFMVSATEVDAVVELCRKEKVDGIITGNVDMLLPYYAQICEKAHLHCYGSLEQFKIMTNKKLFKDICAKYHVPTIKEYMKKEVQEKTIHYPVLIKPVDSSGSRGISVCNNDEELHIAIQKAVHYSKSGKYLIERYMTGEEAVLYYYFQNNRPIFMGMCDRYVTSVKEGVANISTAYVFPSKYTQNHLLNTDLIIQNMFQALKIENGTMFLQAFIEDGIPILYEPGYRLNGAREQYIYSETNGINAIDLLIRFALTGEMSREDINLRAAPYLNGKCACMLSPSICLGKVDRIIGVEKVLQHPAVKEFIYINREGDCVKEEEQGTLRQIAYRAYLVEDTWDKLKKAVEFVQKTVEYFDEKGESMIIGQFDSGILCDYK